MPILPTVHLTDFCQYCLLYTSPIFVNIAYCTRHRFLPVLPTVHVTHFCQYCLLYTSPIFANIAFCTRHPFLPILPTVHVTDFCQYCLLYTSPIFANIAYCTRHPFLENIAYYTRHPFLPILPTVHVIDFVAFCLFFHPTTSLARGRNSELPIIRYFPLPHFFLNTSPARRLIMLCRSVKCLHYCPHRPRCQLCPPQAEGAASRTTLGMT